VINPATTAASGTYSVYNVASGCTSATATVGVTVNSIPATPVINPVTAICAGQNLNLGTAAAAGATYVWSGPNGFTSNVQNPVITAATTAASGTYNLYTVVNGCTSATATINAVVNPIPATPVPGSNSPICDGSALNLTTPAVAGVTYVWSGPNGFSSNQQNPVINPATTAASGTYSVYNVASGCTSATATVGVTVNSIPATPVINSNSPVCSGNDLNLSTSAVAGATYVWSGPNGFTSNVQSPVITAATTAASGTYNLYTVVNGCTSATATTTVTVNQTPTAPVPTVNTPICEGSVLNFTIPAVTGATYVWSGPNGFTSNLQNPVINAATTAATGNYSLNVVVTACTSATTNVSAVVNPIPAQPGITTNSPLCNGQTLNLSTASVAGATYVWSGPNGFSSNAQNPVLTNATPSMSGNYTLYVVVSGCTSATATSAVTIYSTPPTPVPQSNSPVCEGFPLNLSTTALAGATYFWSGPAGFSSGLQNPVINPATPANSGNYSLYIVQNGCTSATGTISVIVNPTPQTPSINSNSPICDGASLNLSTSSVTGATYVWTGPNGFTSGVQNPVINPASVAAGGTYNLYTVVNGCTSATASQPVIVYGIPGQPVVNTNSPLCDGATLNLTTNAVAGASYFWSGPAAFTSGVQNPVINGVTTTNGGSYNLYVVVNGCTSSTGSSVVTVYPIPATPTVQSNSPICEGSNLNLTTPAVTGATYVWTGPNGFTSGLQNPVINAATPSASGTYNLYIVVNGCTSATGSVTTIVYPTPGTPQPSVNTPVCDGSDLNFNSNLINGATYYWSGPNGFISNLQNPVITGATTAATGTYNLYVTANGCTSSTVPVVATVYAIPAQPILQNNGPLCDGSTLNLSSNTISGATYVWTGPNGFTSGLQNPVVANAAPAQSGNYDAYVIVNGCTSSVSTTLVTIYPIPAAPIIGSNSPICDGSNLNLTSNTIAGATYVWSGPNGFISALEDPVLTGASPSATGSYNMYVVVNGCTSATSTLNATVYPIPQAPQPSGNTPICDGTNLNLTSNTIAGATYVWSGPNGFSSALQNPVITSATPAATGNYTLYVVVNGCTSAASTFSATVYPIPAAPLPASNSPVCDATSLNLSSNSIAGATYYWSGPAGFSSNLQNPSISPAGLTAAGTYNLYVTVNGCTSATASTQTTVYPIPTSTFTISGPVCPLANASFTYTGTASAGATYNWNFGTGTTAAGSGQGPISVNWSTSGNQTVTLSVTENNCTSVQSSQQITIYPVFDTYLTEEICQGTSYTIGASSFNTTGNYTVILPTVHGCDSTVHLNLTVHPVFTTNLTEQLCQGQSYTIGNSSFNSTGNYSVLLQTIHGCDSTVNLNLTVYQIPTSIFTLPTQTCVGTNVSVNYTGNASATGNYVWNFGGATANPGTGQGPQTLSWNTPGTYDVSLHTDENNCFSDTTKLTIIVYPVPTSSFTLNNQVCEGRITNIIYTGTASGNAQYSWTIPGNTNINGSGQGPLNVSWNTAGTYVVSLSVTENACTSTLSSDTIIVHSFPAVNAGPNVTVCSGYSTFIGTSGLPTVTYQWNPAAGLTSPTNSLSELILTHNGPGPLIQNYVLSATENGCTAYDTTTVTVNVLPIAQVQAPGPQCIFNNSFDFAAGGTFGNTSNFNWTFQNALPGNSALQNPNNIHFLTAGQQYVVLSITENNCPSVPDTAYVTVFATPIAAFTPSSISGCVPATVQFFDQSQPGGGLNYTWNFGDGNQSSAQNTSNIYTQTGTYDVSLIISDGNGCSDTVIMNSLIQINPVPEADFTALPTLVYVDKPLVEITDASANSTIVQYFISDGSSYSLSSFGHTFDAEGEYQIQQIVSNQYGCSDTAYRNITVRPVTEIYIPNSFTPNGDGINDNWKINMTYMQNFNLTLFDRWGVVVFYTEDIYEQWNGTYKNNGTVNMKEDAYVYLIKYIDSSGKDREIRGHVTLIR
jgi:gliding motility-associated-like protein